MPHRPALPGRPARRRPAGARARATAAGVRHPPAGHRAGAGRRRRPGHRAAAHDLRRARHRDAARRPGARRGR
nr:hypothetical protein [Angustibacter aerolatus]